MPAAPSAIPTSTGRSPWCGPQSAYVALQPPDQPPRVTVQVPGSKSLSNRLLLLAAVARGTSTLHHLLRGDDVFWAVALLRQLGLEVTVWDDPGDATVTARVTGCGAAAPLGGGGWGPRWPRAPQAPLFVGDAGTLGRFVPGLLLAGAGGPWTLDGSPQLQRRPITPLLGALQQLFPGQPSCGSGLPLRLWGQGDLPPPPLGKRPELWLSGELSSQFSSALLLLAPLLSHGLRLHCTGSRVQPAYVEMTAACLRDFGATVDAVDGGQTYQVQPGGYAASTLRVAADLSTAAYFWSAAALSGGSVHVAAVPQDGLQPDLEILEVLRRFGARVVRRGDGITVVGPPTWRGGGDFDLRGFSDQAPTVAALAALADQPVRLRGVGHIRHHESNRLATFAAALATLGGHAEVLEDGLRILPRPLHGGVVQTHGDHRIAMATALLCSRVQGIRIADPGCVGKTCPQFFTLLTKLGFGVNFQDKI